MTGKKQDNSRDLKHRARIDAALRAIVAALNELQAARQAAREDGLSTDYGDGFHCPHWSAEDRFYDGFGRPHIRVEGNKPLSMIVKRYYAPLPA